MTSEVHRISTDDFDSVFKHVGGFGRFQIISFLLLFFASYVYGYLSIATVFLAPRVDHWCRNDALTDLPPDIQRCVGVPFESNSFSMCTQFVLPRSYTIPDDVYNCDVTNRTLNTESMDIEDCNEWEYDRSVFTETAVTEVRKTCL